MLHTGANMLKNKNLKLYFRINTLIFRRLSSININGNCWPFWLLKITLFKTSISGDFWTAKPKHLTAYLCSMISKSFTICFEGQFKMIISTSKSLYDLGLGYSPLSLPILWLLECAKCLSKQRLDLHGKKLVPSSAQWRALSFGTRLQLLVMQSQSVGLRSTWTNLSCFPRTVKKSRDLRRREAGK